MHGSITYNGETAESGQFLLPKLAVYIDELDEHIPNLTVQETFEFAWRAATGGRHSYLVSSNATGKAMLDRDNPNMTRVRDTRLFVHVCETYQSLTLLVVV